MQRGKHEHMESRHFQDSSACGTSTFLWFLGECTFGFLGFLWSTSAKDILCWVLGLRGRTVQPFQQRRLLAPAPLRIRYHCWNQKKAFQNRVIFRVILMWFYGSKYGYLWGQPHTYHLKALGRWDDPGGRPHHPHPRPGTASTTIHIRVINAIVSATTTTAIRHLMADATHPCRRAMSPTCTQN